MARTSHYTQVYSSKVSVVTLSYVAMHVISGTVMTLERIFQSHLVVNNISVTSWCYVDGPIVNKSSAGFHSTCRASVVNFGDAS